MDENNTSQEVSQDPVISALQESLISGAQVVSSETTGVEDTISKAIGKVESSQKASEKRIESSFGRQFNYAAEQGQRSVDAFAEARRGFATQQAGLRNLVGETDKFIADLESRREEALLANDSQATQQISQLMIQGEQMKMDALQNTFNNLLAVSSFGLNARQFELGQSESKRQFNLTYELQGEQFQLQKDQQSFTERNAMAQLATEFGLELAPDDTIDTLVTRAAQTGAVSERRALELEALRAQIANSNAQAARALRQDASEQPFDPITAEVLANAYRNGDTSFLSGLKTNEQFAAVIGKVNEIDAQTQDGLQRLANVSASAEDFLVGVGQIAATLPEGEAARLNQMAASMATGQQFSGNQTAAEISTLSSQGSSFIDMARNLSTSLASGIIDLPRN